MAKKNKSSKEKTNPMRILDYSNIIYTAHSYDASKGISGKEVARSMNIDENILFKTLVTEGKSKEHYVFVIPVSSELNLKKAAIAADEKSISMIKQSDLLPLTGYVHGGCSPLGMKKSFKTFFHDSALSYDTIYFNGGKIGTQIQCSAKDLISLLDLEFKDII